MSTNVLLGIDYLDLLQKRFAMNDYADLLDGKKRVITFGDGAHLGMLYKNEFIRSLPQLKKAGIDTVAIIKCSCG